MANIKSAIKRIKKSRRNEKRNRIAKSSVRTYISKAKELLGGKSDDAKKALIDAIKKIDKAVSKGILHKKTASRKKSRLMVYFNRKSK